MSGDTRLSSPARAGFSLLELLASAAVFSVILLVIFIIIQSTGNAWRMSRSNIEAFQGARLAFESMTAMLSQSTLNTYYDYFDDQGRSSRDSGFSAPHHYARQSDLHFVSGKSLLDRQITHAVFFQVAAGYVNKNEPRFKYMNSLLNVCGFYIFHGDDPLRPKFLDSLPHPPPDATRYRLMQFFQPSEEMSVYSTLSNSSAWFRDFAESSNPPIQQMAENVIALVLVPRLSTEEEAQFEAVLAPEFDYDSRKASASSFQSLTHNQLPPLIDVVLVAVDELSAQRIERENLQFPKLFESNSAELAQQLADFEAFLIEQKLTYRILRSTVPLRNSKWSS